jgi:hypothetical protein
MITSPLNKIVFEPTSCISSEQLLGYSDGSLNPNATRKVEEHLADCELCSRAVEGFLLVSVTSADLSSIHSKIDSVSVSGWFSSLNAKIILSTIVLGITGACIWGPGILSSKNDRPGLLTALDNGASGFKIEEGTMNRSTVSPAENYLEPAIGKADRGIVSGGKQETEKRASQPSSAKNDLSASNIPVPMNGIHPALVDIQSLSPASAPGLKQPTYNRPLRYIYSMKVSDYNALYLLSDKTPAVISDMGLPANREQSYSVENDDLFRQSEQVQSADEVLKKGLLAFKEAHYGKALRQFYKLIDLNPSDINSLFYSGVCCYKLDKPAKCITLLDKVLAMENNAFTEEALWYKAQAMLSVQDKAGAKATLEKIADEQGFYSEEAKVLLNKLSSAQPQ